MEQHTIPQTSAPVESQHEVTPPPHKSMLMHIVIGLVILAVGFGGGWYMGTKSFSKDEVVIKQSADVEELDVRINNGEMDTAIITDDEVIKGWKKYVNEDAGYSFSYPQTYEIHQSVATSTDGVKIKSENRAVQIVSPNLPEVQTNYRLTIIHSQVENTDSLENMINTNNWCSQISMNVTEPYILAGAKGFIVKDSPCGQYGSTVIYVLHEQTLYFLKIESGTNYKQILSEIDQILSTFEFVE
ncbi:MAG: hypothetical protein O3B87_04600 [bacterium]|nr:hypothetical protein [bacterium]